jgi:hypothetical protein
MFLDHTQRRTTLSRTRPEESYRLWYVVVCDLETSRIGAPYVYDSSLRVKVNHHTAGSHNMTFRHTLAMWIVKLLEISN